MTRQEAKPCDFFLLGWVKEVYHSKPKIIEELEDQIREIMSNIPAEMLRKPVDAISGWLQKLVESYGSHIEFYRKLTIYA